MPKSRRSSDRTAPSRQKKKAQPVAFWLNAQQMAWAGFALFLFIYVKNLWVTEDTFITFRVIDNLLAGHGPRWNLHERVQVYSGVIPFWARFILAYSITPNHYLIALFLNAVTAIGALVLSFYLIAHRVWWFIAVLALTASQGVMDYGSSGLENSYLYLMAVLFLWVYRRCLQDAAPTGMVHLTVLAALSPLMRYEFILLIAPAYAYALFFSASGRALSYPKRAALVVACALPLLAWTAFSLFYYGAFLPNTAISKLNMALPRTEVVAQGIAWLYAVSVHDIITLPLLLLCTVAVLMASDKRYVPIAVGVLLTLLYYVSAGGDYMMSRWLSHPLFFIVCCTACLLSDGKGLRHAKGIAVGLVLYAIVVPLTPLKAPLGYADAAAAPDFQLYGVADEHIALYESTNFWRAYVGGGLQEGRWTVAGKAFRDYPPRLVVAANAGIFAYEMGPEKIFIDFAGVSDPFLARLPFSGLTQRFIASSNPLGLPLSQPQWRAGHLYRHVPKGYPEVLVRTDKQLENADLQAYWEKVKYVTQGELYSWGRVKEAWLLNTGHYDHLLTSVRGTKTDSFLAWLFYDEKEDRWLLPDLTSGRVAVYRQRPF